MQDDVENLECLKDQADISLQKGSLNLFSPDEIKSLKLILGDNFCFSDRAALQERLTIHVEKIGEDNIEVVNNSTFSTLCTLITTLLNSDASSSDYVVTMMCAIAIGFTKILSSFSTRYNSLIEERDTLSFADLENSRELESLMENFCSLQRKCSTLIRIHEDYKVQKEDQLKEALNQCVSLRLQVKEAVEYKKELENEEIKKLKLALSQANLALDNSAITFEIEKSRMEKLYLSKIHELSDELKSLEDVYGFKLKAAEERLYSLLHQNSKLEESLESERERLNDMESQAEILHLRNTADTQLFMITEMKQENESLREKVRSMEIDLKTKNDDIKIPIDEGCRLQSIIDMQNTEKENVDILAYTENISKAQTVTLSKTAVVSDFTPTSDSWNSHLDLKPESTTSSNLSPHGVDVSAEIISAALEEILASVHEKGIEACHKLVEDFAL